MKKFWDKAISFEEYFKKTEEVVAKMRQNLPKRKKKCLNTIN